MNRLTEIPRSWLVVLAALFVGKALPQKNKSFHGAVSIQSGSDY
jgi:hypothetical protein